MKACASEKPNKFTFEEYPRGGYILWLRENFHEVKKEDEETPASWIYDEYTVLMPTTLSNNFIEQHFEEYLSEARKKEASNPSDRLTAAEDAIEDILNILAEITE